MADTIWEAIDIKPFVYSRKALLTSTTTIFGQSDEDMEPTPVKSKGKPAATQKRKAVSNVQMLAPATPKKKKTVVPPPASKPKKLRKQVVLSDIDPEDQIPLAVALTKKTLIPSAITT